MRQLASILIFYGCSCLAQTGPGGVGSSTTNVLWLSANSGITQSGGLVSQWNDQSGNANHAYLPGAIPTAKPAFVSNSVNGYPSLDFDGADDQLWVNDAASVDLTQWHFFMVVTVDVQKDYNAWLVKGDDSDENWEMLSYANGNIHAPTKYTDGTRTFPSSAGGQVTTTAFDVIEYSYSTGVGRDVYKNATTIITDNENKTPKVNNLPLYIGNERSTSGRNVNGDIAEVIAYNAPLNSVQRIVVTNYLAAKYGRTLGSNDLHSQDNSANGNYDHDVAGIGRLSASNLQNDSRGSGIVRINNPTGLGDNEFLLWGHDNRDLDAWGVTDYPASIQGRIARVWRVSEVSTAGAAVDVGNVDMTFDLNGMGAVTASDLRLLVDTDNDGVLADETPLSGATLVSGTLYRFSGVSTLADGRRFTLGTASAFNTPLPIELVSFSAEAMENGSVLTRWVTASEHDNEHFTVERSTDLADWTTVARSAGAGNSNIMLHYQAFDHQAPAGVVYYRLGQTDLDGTTTLSDVVSVMLERRSDLGATVYPNPSEGQVHLILPGNTKAITGLELVDGTGRTAPCTWKAVGEGRYQVEVGDVPHGIYVLRAVDADGAIAGSARIQR